MNIRRSSGGNFLLKKCLQNIFFIGCCALSFIVGNFLTVISMDSTQCNVEMCTEKIKRTNVEDSNQWIRQWNKNLNGLEKTVFLVIVIFSAPTNQEQREAVRQTWLSDELSDTVHYFAIGTGSLTEEMNITIQSEQRKFGDLMLLNNVYDSYEALTKKLLASLVFVHHHVKFRFLLKSDDDTYINLPQLHLDLKAVSYKQRLYWGFFDGRATPKKRGPWMEKEWILCDNYLPYALGGGYILSNDLITFIAVNARFLKLYKSEDVSIGTWLAPLDVHRVHDPRFDTEYKSRGCNNKYVITHKQSTMHMREKFNSLTTTGLLCKSEFKVRNSYVYDWNVPPSKCCIRNDSSVP